MGDINTGDIVLVKFDKSDIDNQGCVDGIYFVHSIDADSNDKNYPVNLYRTFKEDEWDDDWDECCNFDEIVANLENSKLVRLIYE